MDWKYDISMRNKKENLNKKYAGVYAFYVEENGHKKPLYIGSSIEIQDRLSSHLTQLRKGTHRHKVIQEAFDSDTLQFVVLDTITFKDGTNVVKLDADKKQYVFYALSRMEEYYMELFKDTIVNKQKTVKQHSTSSPTKRRKANLGAKNPNVKYSEQVIKEIIWLKENTNLKVKEIAYLINKKHNVEIRESYIYIIGKQKWKNLEGVKPSYIKDLEVC